MYLNKERYFSKYQNNGERPKVEGFDVCESITVRGEVIYWRKANAVHNWFVENVQDGVDECQNAWVSTDKLKELLQQVEWVLEDQDRAESILPTTSGFFFGDTNYGQSYIDDLEHTRDKLKVLLEDPDVDKYDYYYHSSW